MQELRSSAELAIRLLLAGILSEAVHSMLWQSSSFLESRLNSIQWWPMLRTIKATRYALALREGGSMPAIVEADDLGMYVVKFRGAGQGVLALVAELVAGEIGRALGLQVPEMVFAEVDAALGRNEPD